MKNTKEKETLTWGPNDTSGIVWAHSLHIFLLGNAVGNPGVFQGNPHPYPWKPAPSLKGVGFPRV